MLACGVAVAALLLPASACAQSLSYVWGGSGSSTLTSDYSTATNWSTTSAGAPPLFPTQSALFGATGSSTVTIGAGPMLPDSWIFSTNAQSYTISGNPVQFSLSGPTGGLINNANAGQTITVSANIADSIGGAVMVQQLGNSTLVLSGTNGYSGGTVISAGTVQVTNADAIGLGTLSLNGGTFQMQSPTVSSVAFSNNIAVNAAGGTVDANGAQVNLQGVITDGVGAGQLRLIDSSGSTTANVQLSGVNTYSGGTLISGTTAVATNNSSFGTGTVTIGNNGLVQTDGVSNLTFANNFQLTGTAPGAAIDSNGTNLTISGNISGTGKLTILDSFGSGAVVLTGTNSYTGGTVICSCGTLALGDATHTAAIAGAVTNEGRFYISNANTAALTSITTDGGTTIFQNNTSAGSATLVTQNGGNTYFLDASSAGNAAIINQTGGTLSFGLSGGSYTATAGQSTILNSSFVLFEANTNAGTAAITNGNGGTTVFADQASAASSSIVNTNGALTIFTANSTAGNATITTSSGGTVSFFDNATGGNAAFITNGTGIADFSESLGEHGDGRITAGSIAGSGFYYIGGGNTLVVGGNNLSSTVTGVIADNNPCGCTTGSAAFEKTGSGVLTLAGLNTYTGTTTVNGGTLEVDGSIASSSLTSVNSGGVLSGIGTLGATQVASGGTLAPGNASTPTGMLSITGSLAFQSGAIYLVQVTSTTASKTVVSGAASVASQVMVNPLNLITQRTTYTILTSGGLSGSFDTVTLANHFASNAVLSYVGNSVLLTLDPGALTPSLPSGANANQRNVAGAIDNAILRNGSLPGAFDVLFGLSGTALLNALSQASGETATGAQQTTFDAMGQFLGVMTDPFMSRDGGAGPAAGATGYADETARTRKPTDAFAMFTKAPPHFEQRWSVWGAGFGGSQSTDGNNTLGSNNTTSSVAATAVGADYLIAPHTIAGFALAGGGTSFSVANGGSGRSDLFQAGAYLRHADGPTYISAALAYGWQDITTNRTVTIAGSEQLRARFNANAWSGRAEGGYRFVAPVIGGFGITPYAAAQFVAADLPAYAEQAIVGTDAFALAYAAKNATDVRSELGLRTDKSYALPEGILTLRGRFAWAHDYNPDRSIAATFQALPAASFVVNGAAQASESALTTASVEMKWKQGWSVAATFEGEFSDVTTSYAGKGAVRYSW